MERRLAAILAADVMGYSRHTERNEEASTVTLRMYRTVVDEAISAHRGHIFSSAGDGVVAEFPSIVEAIRCAIEIQNEIAERNASVPERDRMQFRIGVNLGDVIAEDNNLYGTGVNVAVRLEQLAEPGGICISQTVYDQVRKIVEIPFQDIGERRLKNIAEPVHVYRILPSPLPWLSWILSRTWRKPRLGAAAGMLVLLLAAGAGSFYLSQPAAWDALLGAGPREEAAIAVQPFRDLRATELHDLAGGITEGLRMALGRFPELHVRARNPSLADTPTDVVQLGKALDVRYVLDGSVQRSDQNLRVTARLTDATTRTQLWSQDYDFDRQEDSIAVRDDVTRYIAGTLGGLDGQLHSEEVTRLPNKLNDFTAYDHVAKGWTEWNKFTEEGNKAARDHFDEAKKIDPNYARAYAGLAWTYSSDHDFEFSHDYKEDPIQLTFENARTAVRLDEYDYVGHWALGWAYLYRKQYDRAEEEYNRARELNPNDSELLGEMGNLLVFIGKPQRAIDQLKDSIRLNTRRKDWYVQYLGWAYEEAGMPKEAIEVLERAIDRQDPTEDQLWVLPSLAAAYAEVGQIDRAHEMSDTIRKLAPDFSSNARADEEPYQPKDRERYVNALIRAGLPE